jgi:hypothetical protein
MAQILDQNELYLNAFKWEPKYTNRFIMYIDGIPTYIIKAAARPSLTNGEIVLDHINIDRKVKGKTRWNDVSITLYDPIVPSGAQAVMEWVRAHHESATGRNGYSTQYKKDITFNSLAADGEKIEEWILKGAFIADTNFGQMDWGTEDAVQIEVTLKYDWALLRF